MANSPLVGYTKLSPNYNKGRNHSIDRITPHCVVGQLSAETICDVFIQRRDASCNYCIGKDGKVGMSVEECNRSWCSSSSENDNRAVTIECASDKSAPYAFNSGVYQSLIKLCVDICRRNGKSRLIWISDRGKALAYEPGAGEMLLTVHRWFANKDCPGNWLMSRMPELAKAVTEALSVSAAAVTETEDDPADDGYIYYVVMQLGAYGIKENAEKHIAKLRKEDKSGAYKIMKAKKA